MSNRRKNTPSSREQCAPVVGSIGCTPDAVDSGQLEDIIQSYRTNKKPEADWTLKYYERLPSIEDAIIKASMALTPEGKRHPHQYRLKREVLEQVKENLLGNKQALSEAGSFHDVWEIVKVCRVEGFGKLAVYDCATRIAAWLGKRPDDVYLHTGTLKGAIKLGIDTKHRIRISVDELPEPLRSLEPYELEDILCIYKDRF